MSIINDLLFKQGDYQSKKHEAMQHLESLSPKEFYEVMKTDKLSKAKCSVELNLTKLCTETSDDCIHYKRAWMVCLKNEGKGFYATTLN